ncbi:lysis system o-spanin lipoprotein Rz1 [Escherichia coli]|uniref:Rz1 family lipoprotein n=1 Tax=Escherichia coli TaxID=562 RepID=UPI003F4ECA31
MLPLVVSACGSMPVAPQPCVKPPDPPAWIMQPAPDWQTPLNGIISPSRERLMTMQKQLEGAQLYIREQCLR